MYCPSCGKEIADEAVVCVGCGRPVTPIKQATPTASAIDIGAKAVHQVARAFLISGIINIIAGFVVTGMGYFLGLFSVIIGIIELVNAYRYWPIPPRAKSNPTWLPTLEMINLIFGPLWSLLIGIGNRKTLNSPEVKAYFAALQSGQPVSINPAVAMSAATPVPAATAAAAPVVAQAKKCPACGNSIPLDAKICQYCRQEFTDESIQASRQQLEEESTRFKADEQRKHKTSQGKTLRIAGSVIAVIGVLILIIFVLAQVLGSSSASAQNTGGFVGAMLLCPVPLILVGVGLFFWGANTLKKLQASL